MTRLKTAVIGVALLCATFTYAQDEIDSGELDDSILTTFTGDSSYSTDSDGDSAFTTFTGNSAYTTRSDGVSCFTTCNQFGCYTTCF